MLAARDLRVTLGGKRILDDVSLSVRPGEVLAVIGPNGAGKSTLLQALAGGHRAAAGAVTLDDRPLGAWPRRDLAWRRAIVPQESPLAFPLRAVEVVLLGRSPHLGRSAPAGDLAVVAAAMAACNVDHLADRDYTTLSGGERQRLHFARALAQVWPEDGGRRAGGARYLLLDEPTANLDLKHQHQILALARRFAADGYGVLAVLHDFNLATVHADRLCLMVQGRVTADGTPEAVLTPPRIEAAFGLSVTLARHPRTGRPLVLPA